MREEIRKNIKYPDGEKTILKIIKEQSLQNFYFHSLTFYNFTVFILITHNKYIQNIHREHKQAVLKW